jgi:hypothetical protein
VHIIPIAWFYVTLLMAVAEASNANGTVLGALITFLLYGLLPIGLMLYFMRTPARRRAIRAREAAEQLAARQVVSLQPDAGGLAPGDAVAPVGKETGGV